MKRIILPAVLAFAIQSHALEQFGRISAGVYESTEYFPNATDGAPYNDYLTGSGRIFYHVTDINRDKMDFVADLRDKYDSFGMLNQTAQELDPKNAFQAKNLYVGDFLSRSNHWNYLFGRFSMTENGGAFTDGLALQRRFSPNARMGIFGGLNPYSDADQLVEFSSNATDYGVYWAYEPVETEFNRTLQLDEALVNDSYNTQQDRFYYYQNFYFQWNPKSRILSVTYLDFTPTTRLQTGTFNWDQRITDYQVSKVHLLAVDSVGYRRIQNIRSTLPTSPYQQGQWQWDFLRGRGV